MPTTVTIIGAGLGGLTLARVLHVHGVPVEVYEADPSPAARHQGGMLDIHEDSGRAAIEAAGLTDGFRRLVLAGREAGRVLDRDGTVVVDMPDAGGGGRPEVQRGELRQLLIDSLPDGTVRWGHKVDAVRALGGGRHEVVFADGRAVATDLLVGADGAWSRVRPLLSGATPDYVGTTFVETWLYDGDTRHPAAARAVGGGSMWALAPGKGIQAHRERGDTLHTYVALAKPQSWFDGAGLDDVAREFDGWAPELTALITDSDTAPVVRPLQTLPVGHRWDRVPGVTLIGDAAHLAPPNGEGANLAMQDGAELGVAIGTHPGDVEAAIAACEQAMVVRGADAAADGAHLYELMFGEHAPHSLVDAFTGPEHW